MSQQMTPKSSAPVLSAFEGTLGYLRWVLPVLTLGYLLSGIIVVGSDEVAVILRFGQLSGGNAATAQKYPGMHYTLPRPIDEVVRVNIKKVYELKLEISILAEAHHVSLLKPSIRPKRATY